MGERGPAPTPTAVLQLRGSWRAGLNREGEPDAGDGVPEMPGWLREADEYAADAWEQFVGEMAPGVLKSDNGKALTALCVSWSHWRKAVEAGDAVLADKLGASLRKWLAEFGLSPSSRTRISVSNPKKEVKDDGHGGQFFKSG